MDVVQTQDREAVDYEKLTVTTGAVKQLTAAKREAAECIFITIEDASIRYRTDGGDPSSSQGHLVTSGQNIYIANAHSVANLRMIAISSSAVAVITYFL